MRDISVSDSMADGMHSVLFTDSMPEEDSFPEEVDLFCHETLPEDDDAAPPTTRALTF